MCFRNEEVFKSLSVDITKKTSVLQKQMKLLSQLQGRSPGDDPINPKTRYKTSDIKNHVDF